MSKKIVGIYCYIDKKDNSIVYVGKDSYIGWNKRHKDHMAPRNYWGQQINRVLQNNKDRYDYKVLFKGDISKKLLNGFEKAFIRMYNPKFNYTTGGDGGYTHTKESINNMSIGKKKWYDREWERYKIIKCGKLNGKIIYGLKIDGELVLTSINRASIFSACFNLDYPVNKIC